MKSFILKNGIFLIFLCLLSFTNHIKAQNLVDFNNISDLTNLFNEDSSPVFSNLIDQGISNTGSVNVPIGSSDVWTTKAGYSVSGEGDVYTLSAYFKIKENSGYGGLGLSAFDQNEPDAKGSPEYGLGMCFHGGGGYFINNRIATSVSWASGDLTLGSWYKMILQLTAKGSNYYDLNFQIWNSDAEGNIGSMYAEKSLNNISNTQVGEASTLHVYFSSAGSRMEKIDNFDISLEGGAVIIPPGQPVVLTTEASEINSSTATSGGNVIDDNENAVSERGVCWNTSGSPTIADGKTSDGTGTGTYTSSIIGLSAETTYYLKSYATNSIGTSYGKEIEFTTDLDIDTDGDGIGNNDDPDDDNDGTLDADDDFPLDPAEDTDTDSDGTGDNADTDDDDDGTLDADDDFPLDAAEDTDTDSDGTGDNADTDDDDDGTLSCPKIWLQVKQ